MITDKMIQYYSLLFFACSILGWCIEVLCKLIQFHRFINRGFLVGPWCPIYGFGAVFISLLLSRHAEDPLAVFGLAILICGILEYSASYMLEKIFHARWWDYSTKKFNLNGRVCADTLLPFGLLGLLLVYAITPVMFSCFDSYSMNTGGSAHELVLYPVPDRVIYDYGNSQKLLWGEPLNGGTEVLPRLALAYYLLIAAALAAVSGLLWFIFRGKKDGIIMRQIFFAPAAYIAAHLLVKGTATTSYFMGRELYFILMIAIALYFLFTLTWQVWLQRRHER